MQNHFADGTQFFFHWSTFNILFVVPDTFTNASPYSTQFSITVGMFLYFSCCHGFSGGCLGYKPYIFFCNVPCFLFLTVPTAQSRQGICYVLATRLVFNGVIKNLHMQYPAFNSGRVSSSLSTNIPMACDQLQGETWSHLTKCENVHKPVRLLVPRALSDCICIPLLSDFDWHT